MMRIGRLAAAAMLAGTAPAFAADGAAVFARRCAGCHGTAGRGDAPGARALKVRPLAGDARLAALTPAEIAGEVLGNAKHHAVVDLSREDLDASAGYVKQIAAGR